MNLYASEAPDMYPGTAAGRYIGKEGLLRLLDHLHQTPALGLT
mgnify:CR=1 FL=1